VGERRVPLGKAPLRGRLGPSLAGAVTAGLGSSSRGRGMGPRLASAVALPQVELPTRSRRLVDAMPEEVEFPVWSPRVTMLHKLHPHVANVLFECCIFNKRCCSEFFFSFFGTGLTTKFQHVFDVVNIDFR
jgi:hypothetical protein